MRASAVKARAASSVTHSVLTPVMNSRRVPKVMSVKAMVFAIQMALQIIRRFSAAKVEPVERVRPVTDMQSVWLIAARVRPVLMVRAVWTKVSVTGHSQELSVRKSFLILVMTRMKTSTVARARQSAVMTVEVTRVQQTVPLMIPSATVEWVKPVRLKVLIVYRLVQTRQNALQPATSVAMDIACLDQRRPLRQVGVTQIQPLPISVESPSTASPRLSV